LFRQFSQSGFFLIDQGFAPGEIAFALGQLLLPLAEGFADLRDIFEQFGHGGIEAADHLLHGQGFAGGRGGGWRSGRFRGGLFCLFNIREVPPHVLIHDAGEQADANDGGSQSERYDQIEQHSSVFLAAAGEFLGADLIHKGGLLPAFPGQPFGPAAFLEMIEDFLLPVQFDQAPPQGVLLRAQAFDLLLFLPFHPAGVRPEKVQRAVSLDQIPVLHFIQQMTAELLNGLTAGFDFAR